MGGTAEAVQQCYVRSTQIDGRLLEFDLIAGKWCKSNHERQRNDFVAFATFMDLCETLGLNRVWASSNQVHVHVTRKLKKKYFVIFGPSFASKAKSSDEKMKSTYDYMSSQA